MKDTLVFGASLKPNRYSNIVIHRLVDKEIDTQAFGLRLGTIRGVEVKTKIENLQNPHTVSLYINPSRQFAYYQNILNLKPKRVIFNPGTENPEFYELLKENGVEAEVACTLVLLGTGQY